MIKFVDMSSDIKPLAAFFCTATDQFVENAHGHHTFICMGEIRDPLMSDVLEPLLPLNFFDRRLK